MRPYKRLERIAWKRARCVLKRAATGNSRCLSGQLLGLNSSGQVVFKKRVGSREKLVKFIAGFPLCTIAMGSCGGSNHCARKFSNFGQEAKFIHLVSVKPYVKANRNNFNDVEGVCEAA